MGAILSGLFGGGSAATDDDSSEPSRVMTFNSTERWLLHFNEVKESSKLMVVDFSAAWCGPCKLMEPAIKEMAARFTEVDFVKIDVDELPEVAKEYLVQAMPTFLLFREGEVVDRIVGAKKEVLERKIEKLMEVPKFAA